MKIIHTSDWHIGRTLYGRKRYEESEAFLNWLAEVIESREVEVLLVAGDVFDNIAPSNRAQELYYKFLHKIAGSCCRHVVITAGNHDSPSFLNAPREVLRFLNVYVVGCISDSLDDEVLVLLDKQGTPELIVCAVPYLRDRDIRRAEPGESIRDKESKLVDAIKAHYHSVGDHAVMMKYQFERAIPIVGMGHLFAAGGQTVEGDGVQKLYIGSLAEVKAEVFPDCMDYLALGHLHVPQKVGGMEHRRYSGSPLPVGFGEAKQQKMVCEVLLSGEKPQVTDIMVPKFQALECIRGDWESITERLSELILSGDQTWLEIIYEGEEIIGDLRQRLDQAVSGSSLEIFNIKNKRIMERVLKSMDSGETLDDMDINDVFKRCLDAYEIPEGQREELLMAYQETVALLIEDDVKAD